MASRTIKASGRLSSASRSINCRGLVTGDSLGDCEEEGCPLPDFGFDPDSASVEFNHALANRQTDAGPAIFGVTMEPLEYAKDFLLVLRIDTDPVVLD